MHIRDLVRREGPRRLLWLPIALAMGIGIYFGLPQEPSLLTGPVAAMSAVALAVWLRRWSALAWTSLIVAIVLVGFSAATLRTRMTATTMAQRELWTQVEGQVMAVERRPADWRLTLSDIALNPAVPDARPPSGARITVSAGLLRRSGADVSIGDRIQVRARLRPPSAPVAPGAFDFQRDAFFRGIGAVGFAVGPIVIVRPAARRLDDGLWAGVDRVRDAAARRIRASLPDPAGPVAAAMLLGDRAGIDETTAQVFRATGLAHLLAISGLHMGLVAGTVFTVVRTTLAVWPALALGRPIKKWAAVAALVAAGIYLLLAGAPVPTQRAFLMTGLVLGAVLLDREAVSLHLVAWAAAMVLLVSPESLTGPSFQLSFAAVTALIAFWETLSARRRYRPDRRFQTARRALGYLTGVAATSIVASAVTAPIVAHHFQQVPLLGAVANLLAVPLTAFVTMPAGVATLVAMPFDLEAVPLTVMGWGIDATLWAARRSSDGPLTAVGVPALGTFPLVALALGGLWTAIWRTPIRWLGGVLVAIAAFAAVQERPPDALISADGDLSAVHIVGQGWLVSRDTGRGFVRDAWRRRWGGDREASFLTADHADRPEGLACDGLGCVVRANGRILAMPVSPEAALEDCAYADVIVTGVRVRGGCPTRSIVIDRDDLLSRGAHAIWLTPQGASVRSVVDTQGDRPWVVGRSAPRILN